MKYFRRFSRVLGDGDPAIKDDIKSSIDQCNHPFFDISIENSSTYFQENNQTEKKK